MSRPSARSLWLRAPLLAAIVVAGCGKSDQVKSDTAAGAKAVNPASADTTQLALRMDSAAVVQLAGKYTFMSRRPPVPTGETLATSHNRGVKIAEKPLALTIETASGSTSTGAHIVARIDSDKAYPDLGIGHGTSYLLVLKAGSSQQVTVVSMTPFRFTPLTRAYPPRPYSHGTPEEPRIVYSEFQSSPGPTPKANDMIAYAFCVEDGTCTPVNHCGYNVF